MQGFFVVDKKTAHLILKFPLHSADSGVNGSTNQGNDIMK